MRVDCSPRLGPGTDRVAPLSPSRHGIEVSPGVEVSALLLRAPQERACIVLGHGAGAGMEHPSMVALSEDLAGRGLSSLRYQFPYMERGSKRPDPPALCHATVRAAVAKAHLLLPAVALFAGGRSFGGRMSSQAQAITPLSAIRGLVFFAFPLHPAEKPGIERAQHLGAIRIPMLFLQGTRDALATLSLLQEVVRGLGDSATLKLLDGADHSFHVPARAARGPKQIRADMLDALEVWITPLLA
jgi:predicted alpha/beta-hydrolase family hydrolase